MILISGESLMDMLPGKQAGQDVYLPVPGGSPFNVAMALGRLRIPVKYLCPLSTDGFGKALLNKLNESQVDTSWCRRSDSPSTLGFVSYNGNSHQPSYHFYTKDTAGCGLGHPDVPETLPEEIKCIHAGSFSLAVEPFGTTIEKLITEQSRQKLVSIDPNVRPFVIKDEAAYRARMLRLFSLAHIVKLSDEDLHWLYPGEKPEIVVNKILGAGTKLVVLTSGASGATAFSHRSEARVNATAVHVVDTVGAGDTFQAALLGWLHENTEMTVSALENMDAVALADMLDFAAMAAAINCTRAGCNPPRLSELNRPIQLQPIVF